ncbi:MAG: hypothetical protein NZ889_01590 [Candidatus Pacearchaeota archaeon]|nr:hypothetical protein [Candidatus Pacearchaeota archaeon]
MELQCLKCHYQYESEKIPLTCPFCGSEKSVKPVPSASELLLEAEEAEKKAEEAEKRKQEWKEKLQEK